MITQLAQGHTTDFATPVFASQPVSERAPRGAALPVRALKTDRLTLTALKSTDFDAIMSIFGHAGTARMSPNVPSPLSRDDAQAMLRDMMLTGNAHWAIRMPDGRMAGVLSLRGPGSEKRDGIHNFGPDLSVYIDPVFQGRGYAHEAIDGLLAQLRRDDRHRVVHAMHFADNEAYARTLINAGFLYTGRRTPERSLAREGEHQALHMIRIL